MAAAASPPRSRKASIESLSFEQVQVAIIALGQPASSDQLDLLCALLERFVSENEDPCSSPHLRATRPDRLEPLVTLLGRADVAKACPQARLLALKALKILARRQDMRLRCTQHLIDVVAPLLDFASSSSTGGRHSTFAASLASEAANALSNLCYEPTNASGLVKAGGALRLTKLLSASAAGAEAHTNAAGALQTLSFTQDGRTALLKAGAPAAVLQRLASARSSSDGAGAGATAPSSTGEPPDSAEEGKLLQRLVGALHNLSSGAEGTAVIRQQGGIPHIAALLQSAHPGVAASAAGSLQNMSREAAARADIRAQPGAVAALTELLIGPDGQSAVCAAATLANLVSEGGASAGAQDTLADALAGALAAGAIFHSLGAGRSQAAGTMQSARN